MISNNDGMETGTEIIGGKWISIVLQIIVTICVITGIDCQMQTNQESASSLWEFITSFLVGFAVAN